MGDIFIEYFNRIRVQMLQANAFDFFVYFENKHAYEISLWKSDL